MPGPEKFKESLELFKVDKAIIEEINNGYDSLVSSSNIKEKSQYFAKAMEIFDKKLDNNKKIEIMDYNACSKGGARGKTSKAHAKKIADLNLSEKIKTIKEMPAMGDPILNEDGSITAGLWNKAGEKYKCGCPCFNKLKEQPFISLTYCLCCAGHFKYHYETMLGIKLKTKEVKSSPLNSNGKEPCILVFEICKE
jgi:hypothetical protein